MNLKNKNGATSEHLNALHSNIDLCFNTFLQLNIFLTSRIIQIFQLITKSKREHPYLITSLRGKEEIIWYQIYTVVMAQFKMKLFTIDYKFE